MSATDNRKTAFAIGLSSAIAMTMLSGCAGGVAPRADVSAAEAQKAMDRGKHGRAIQHAEAAVEAEPHSAAYRAMLGQAYLDAGRFASAEASFQDAMSLGENNARTALSLALAQTAQAKYADASALLAQWEGEIAEADIGLALALAGNPERGIHIMSNAIRRGDNSAKMRQNLAYAYAVAGRWREARLMAQQDIPAGEVGHRLAEWAELVSAHSYERRIASLLNVPTGVHDAGQPVHLALANNPTSDQLAAEALAPSTPAVRADVELAAIDAAPVAAAPAQLAPIQPVATQPAAAQPAAPLANRYTASVPAAEPLPAPKSSASANFAAAFASPVPAASSLSAVSQDTNRYMQQAVVQKTPASAAAVSQSRQSLAKRSAAPAPAKSAPSKAAPASSVDGTHLVQLGSFSSEAGAKRAWNIYLKRYPELANQEMVITQAIVRGKKYYRVSAGGYDQRAGNALCSHVKSSGGDGCITWAAASPLPGAIDTGILLARR